jgi:hypothetical protein
MSKTISAGKTPAVEIEMIGGDLSVVGWEGDDILIKANRANASKYPVMMIFHFACPGPPRSLCTTSLGICLYAV